MNIDLKYYSLEKMRVGMMLFVLVGGFGGFGNFDYTEDSSTGLFFFFFKKNSNYFQNKRFLWNKNFLFFYTINLSLVQTNETVTLSQNVTFSESFTTLPELSVTKNQLYTQTEKTIPQINFTGNKTINPLQ